MSYASSSEAPRQPSPSEKRSSQRIPVALPVLIEDIGGHHNARVHNLSSGGAMIEAPLQIRTGGQIGFTCGSIETRGTIVWQDSNRFGVKFRLPLAEACLAQQVARSEAAARLVKARVRSSQVGSHDVRNER